MHCIGKFIDSCWKYFLPAEVIHMGVSAKQMLRCNYCPWDKTAVHNGKSDFQKYSQPLTSGLNRGDFHIFLKSENGTVLFCFVACDYIEVIFRKDAIVLWWTNLSGCFSFIPPHFAACWTPENKWRVCEKAGKVDEIDIG